MRRERSPCNSGARPWDGWLGFLLPHGRLFQYVYVAAISLQTGSDRLQQTCFILRLRPQGTSKVAKGKSRLGLTVSGPSTCKLPVKWFGIVLCYYLHYAASLRALLPLRFQLDSFLL
ncbi:unnamed protein product [Musa textilis]